MRLRSFASALYLRVLALAAALLFPVAGQGSLTVDLTESGATTLDQLLEEKRYPEFEKLLSSVTLNENDRVYFEGILADRLNQHSASEDRLIIPGHDPAVMKDFPEASPGLAGVVVRLA